MFNNISHQEMLQADFECQEMYLNLFLEIDTNCELILRSDKAGVKHIAPLDMQ